MRRKLGSLLGCETAGVARHGGRDVWGAWEGVGGGVGGSLQPRYGNAEESDTIQDVLVTNCMVITTRVWTTPTMLETKGRFHETTVGRP